MKLNNRLFFTCLASFSFILTACSTKDDSVKNGTRDNTPVILIPTADQTETIGNQKIVFDLSHKTEGYIMVKYNGNNSKVKVQIKNPNDETLYSYDVLEGFNTYPLTGGSGSYTFTAWENVKESEYSLLYKKQVEITLKDEYTTFLYPSQFVNFTKDTKAVSLGQEVAKGADTDLDVVSQIYDYVIETISYDDDKAQKVKDGKLNGYLPNIDKTLETKKGICFDYASLMATMLRTQNIPTRLLIGYVQTSTESIYHAWIGVYIQDVGWIDDFIQFDGKNWSMMDPTFASENHNSNTIKDFISNTNNYSVKYIY